MIILNCDRDFALSFLQVIVLFSQTSVAIRCTYGRRDAQSFDIRRHPNIRVNAQPFLGLVIYQTQATDG